MSLLSFKYDTTQYGIILYGNSSLSAYFHRARTKHGMYRALSCGNSNNTQTHTAEMGCDGKRLTCVSWYMRMKLRVGCYFLPATTYSTQHIYYCSSRTMRILCIVRAFPCARQSRVKLGCTRSVVPIITSHPAHRWYAGTQQGASIRFERSHAKLRNIRHIAQHSVQRSYLLYTHVKVVFVVFFGRAHTECKLKVTTPAQTHTHERK